MDLVEIILERRCIKMEKIHVIDVQPTTNFAEIGRKITKLVYNLIDADCHKYILEILPKMTTKKNGEIVINLQKVYIEKGFLEHVKENSKECMYPLLAEKTREQKKNYERKAPKQKPLFDKELTDRINNMREDVKNGVIDC